MNVLVTGGAGYIGSVVAEALREGGHAVVVYDSLVKGHRGAVGAGDTFVRADLTNTTALRRALEEHRIEGVIHMAAHSIVGESVSDPAKYYDNNVTAGLSLLGAMRDVGVGRLVFSSTAAVYGEPEKQPIEEGDETRPTNPYGESKLAFERALRWYGEAYGLRHVSLRYFNAAGATRERGEWHDPETHLIPLVLRAAAGARARVQIFGDDYPTRDGTCVRDYIHVMDLARAHILALESAGDGSAVYNLGCGGEGYTVRQVIDAASEVTGREIPTRTVARRAGDPATLIASSAKIKRELGWEPVNQTLHAIIDSAWAWAQEHPRGYEGGPADS